MCMYVCVYVFVLEGVGVCMCVCKFVVSPLECVDPL